VAGGGGGFADHIISGSTNVYVNSATSTISFTTNGSVANYFDASGRLITTGISVTTNQMSATTGYFSGKVGVGTISPLKKLSVVASSSGDGISIEGSSASGFSPQLSLVSDSTINGALVYAQVAGHGISNAVAGDLVLKSNDTAGSLLLATSATECIRMTAAGNVGIGTSTPTGALQVSGTFTVSLSTQTTTPTFYANSSGNVGIGTSSPAVKLHVAGAGDVYSYLESTSGGAAYLKLRAPNSSYAAHNSLASYDESQENWYIGGTGADTNSLVFRTNGTNNRMMIDSSGNVGIGTMGPSYKLHVGSGQVRVDATSSTSAYGLMFCPPVRPPATRWRASASRGRPMGSP
jgi:hypothetical protein